MWRRMTNVARKSAEAVTVRADSLMVCCLEQSTQGDNTTACEASQSTRVRLTEGGINRTIQAIEKDYKY